MVCLGCHEIFRQFSLPCQVMLWLSDGLMYILSAEFKLLQPAAEKMLFNLLHRDAEVLYSFLIVLLSTKSYRLEITVEIIFHQIII